MRREGSGGSQKRRSLMTRQPSERAGRGTVGFPNTSFGVCPLRFRGGMVWATQQADGRARERMGEAVRSDALTVSPEGASAIASSETTPRASEASPANAAKGMHAPAHAQVRAQGRAVSGAPAASIGVCVLAAGASRRMGRPKLLLPFPTETEAVTEMWPNSASRGATTTGPNPANGGTPAAAATTAGGSPSQHEAASSEASGGKALAATACDDAPEPEAATAAGVTLLERALGTSPALARGRTGSRPLSQRGWRRARTRLRLNSLKQHMEAHRVAAQGVGRLTAGQRLVRPSASFVKGALMLRISVQLHNGVVHRSSSQHSSSAPANRSTSPSME